MLVRGLRSSQKGAFPSVCDVCSSWDRKLGGNMILSKMEKLLALNSFAVSIYGMLAAVLCLRDRLQLCVKLNWWNDRSLRTMNQYYYLLFSVGRMLVMLVIFQQIITFIPTNLKFKPWEILCTPYLLCDCMASQWRLFGLY